MKMPASLPAASTMSTAACRALTMRCAASVTTALSRRQIGAAGTSTSTVSSNTAGLIDRSSGSPRLE